MGIACILARKVGGDHNREQSGGPWFNGRYKLDEQLMTAPKKTWADNKCNHSLL